MILPAARFTLLPYASLFRSGLFRRLYRFPHANRRGKCEGGGMQCRSAFESARVLVLAPDRRAEMLVRRQDRDLESIVAVASGGAGASERPEERGGRNRSRAR